MSSKATINYSLLQWCSHQDWDFGLILGTPPGISDTDTARNLARMTTEMELKDGAMDFHWASFIPREPKQPFRDFFLLVGGLSLGDWFYWSRRWPLLFGMTEPTGSLAYEFRKDLAPLLDKLSGMDLTIQIHAGPKKIRRPRKTAVDEEGMARDLEKLVAPDRLKKPKLAPEETWGQLTFPSYKGGD